MPTPSRMTDFQRLPSTSDWILMWFGFGWCLISSEGRGTLTAEGKPAIQSVHLLQVPLKGSSLGLLQQRIPFMVISRDVGPCVSLSHQHASVSRFVRWVLLYQIEDKNIYVYEGNLQPVSLSFFSCFRKIFNVMRNIYDIRSRERWIQNIYNAKPSSQSGVK